jgi:hypothetical protein
MCQFMCVMCHVLGVAICSIRMSPCHVSCVMYHVVVLSCSFCRIDHVSYVWPLLISHACHVSLSCVHVIICVMISRSCVICHCIMCHVLCVMCHVSYCVMCHMLYAICHMSVGVILINGHVSCVMCHIDHVSCHVCHMSSQSMSWAIV